jgi:hypothetical protein
MAELTPIDEKLGEVLGLAQAAQQLTGQVAKLADDRDTKQLLSQMSKEAKETADRAKAIAGKREGRKTAIEAKARETKRDLSDMAKTYLEGKDTDELDGFEFLVMAEAGELGHVEVIERMNKEIGDQAIDELVRFAKPIQERHVQTVHDTTLELAAEEAKAV